MPYFNSNKTKLYYKIVGSGTPVVLIAGLASHHRSWGFQLIYLKKWFKLITFDNKGIGFSMGGMIALEYAAKNPDRVRSLVLSSLPVLEDLGSFDTFISELNPVLTKSNSNQVFQTLATMFFSSDFLKCKQYEILADFFGKNLNLCPPETVSWQIYAIREWLLLKNWTIGCNCPCMMIFGSEDKLVPVKNAMAITSKFFPHAIKKVIKGAGHAVHIERPKQFNKSVYSFLKSHTC